jgi:hypothetical protein
VDLRAIEQLENLDKLKNPLTLWGTEAETFQFVRVLTVLFINTGCA